MQQTALTFTRYGESDTDEDTGYPIEGSVTPLPDVLGSLQPLRMGESQEVKQSGNETFGAYKFYTSTKLNGLDDNARTQPDSTVIDGVVYTVFDSGNWVKTVLSKVAHYKVILIRKGKHSGN